MYSSGSIFYIASRLHEQSETIDDLQYFRAEYDTNKNSYSLSEQNKIEREFYKKCFLFTGDASECWAGDNFLLSEDGQTLLTENNEEILIE